MHLYDLWFILIGVLWTGFFVLEGFDYGVGMLLPFVSKDDVDRRVVLNTIGPVWDGNEVWMIVAGAAIFAAFPQWYASLFAGFYLALLLVLVALIVRGVAFEYRGKRESATWRGRWDLIIAISSFLLALLFGTAWANILKGVPMDAAHDVHVSLFALLNPFGLLGGLLAVAVFAMHGATFLALKTDGEVRTRARAWANRLAPAAILLVVVAVLVSQLMHAKWWTWTTGLLAIGAFVAAWLLGRRAGEGWSFTFGALGIALMSATVFGSLFPNVLPSTSDPAGTLTVANSSSGSYTLKVMTIVAVIFTPLVLLYQAWSYWVFRRRVSRRDIPVVPPAVAATAGKATLGA